MLVGYPKHALLPAAASTASPPGRMNSSSTPSAPPPVQPALESIAVQNVGCSVHGCAAVDELMRNTGSLRRLHLYNNMSGDEGAASIAR